MNLTELIARRLWLGYCKKHIDEHDKQVIKGWYADIERRIDNPTDRAMFCTKLHVQNPPNWRIALDYYVKALEEGYTDES